MPNLTNLKEIKKLVDNSKNPFFLFDEDCDGLCSYLLFKRYCKKGNGRVVKDSPIVKKRYASIVNKYKADLVVVLDKPIIEQEFVDNCKCKVVWIDHHPIVDIKNIVYFNPKFENPNAQGATTYLAYKCVGGDKWVATIGCVADFYMPDFIRDVKKEYDLFSNNKDIEELIYNSKLGEIIKILSFLLKYPAEEVMDFCNILEDVKNPFEILNFEGRCEVLKKEFFKINKQYEDLLKKALVDMKKDGKLLWFVYPDQKISFSSLLSSFLKYSTGEKVVLLGRDDGKYIKGSLRSISMDLRPIVKLALENLNDAHGGGHKNACGFGVRRDDFDRFLERVKEEVNKQ